MTWINIKNCYGYFGSAEDDLRGNADYDFQKFLMLQKKLINESKESIDSLFFLMQTHSASVFVLENKSDLKKSIDLFRYQGDAIITTEKNIGIGVVTADCLPIILFDQKNQAVGIVHAGWQGLSKKIISATILKMHETFKTQPANVSAYLGPSAGVCCYEIQDDLLSHFPKNVFEKKIVEIRDGKNFLNTYRAGFLELLDNNILESSIEIKNSCCTICSPGYCSFRRQKENAGRQPTVVFLT